MSQFIMPQEISLKGFEIVSGTLFRHCPKTSEPSCTLWSTSISFSKSSILALNCCEYILLRVNNETKSLLISPIPSTDKNAFSWSKGKQNLVAKKIDCKAFTSQLFEDWGLDPKHVYRAYGHIVMSDQKVMLYYDFTKAEYWDLKN